ncbi:MAG: hypothetical protein AAF533_23960 [Acidobacteriota bacterium]
MRRLHRGLLAATLLVVPGLATAEVTGSTTTIFRFFDLRHDRPEVESVRTYRPLDQHVRLNWSDLGAKDRWEIDLHARGRVDLATGQRGGEDELQVLLAEATWRRPSGKLSVHLGRQRSLTGLGWRAFDGVKVQGRPNSHVHLFGSLGFPVELGENESSDTDGLTYAGGLRLRLAKTGSFGLDYERREFDGKVREETAGADLELRLGRVQVHANADYSLLLDRFGETAVVASFSPAPRHHVEGRVLRVQPILPADSIFVVFTSNPVTEQRVAYTYRTDKGLSLGTYFLHANYEDTDVPGPEDLDRAAVTASYRGPGVRKTKHRGEIGWQSGFSGDRLAARYDVDFDLNPRWRLGGGAAVNRYENRYRLDDSDQVVALRSRLTYRWRQRFELAMSLEQFFGRDRDNLRGSVVVRTLLGKARQQRPWWQGGFDEGWVSRPAESRERPVVERGAQ